MRPNVSLRPTTPDDLPTLFEHQLDPESNFMAGTKPYTQEKFREVWDRAFAEAAVVPRVIVEDGRVVGGISCFQKSGQNMIGYWIDRPHWGRGIASQALARFLQELKTRPLYAHAARWNAASIRVLEKCGFRLIGWHAEPATDRYVAGEVAMFVLD
jgi:RimJ/RimL family protein N-acetyltransferase